MKRRHLVELHELHCCPAKVRDTLTDILRLSIRVNRIFEPVLKLLPTALKNSGARQIVDLCSGSGGPWPELNPGLNRAGSRYPVRLTDKFPNLDAAREFSLKTDRNMSYENRPIDATAVPAELDGFRTLFSSFHHFTPRQARQILADAVARQQGIAIFEFTRRDFRALLAMLLSPLMVLLFVPFLRPFRWSRLFWTYLAPLVPLVLTIDGLISCLRTYSVAELQALTHEFTEYQWEIGEVRGSRWPIPVTYLIGYPSASIRNEQTQRFHLEHSAG